MLIARTRRAGCDRVAPRPGHGDSPGERCSGDARREQVIANTGNATVRLHGDLLHLVARDRREGAEIPVTGTPSVKDRIESLGVPHTELALVLVDGVPVDLHHRLEGGEEVEVWPRFCDLPCGDAPPLRPDRPRPARFVADVHLATLARDLRLLGFDTRWSVEAGDAELARRSAEENRILLTRDRRLLQRSTVVHGFLVRQDDPLEQIVDVATKLDLLDECRPFERCLACNGRPVPVPKGEVEHLLEPRTRAEQHEFRQCPSCGRVYWAGSHADRLALRLDEIRQQVTEARLLADPRSRLGR